MAYIKEYKKYNTNFSEAYFQVQLILWKVVDDEEYIVENSDEKVIWNKRELCEALVDIYGDNNARLNRVSPIDTIKVKFTYDKNSNLNIIQQAYDKLKTLDDFKGGKDC